MEQKSLEKYAINYDLINQLKILDAETSSGLLKEISQLYLDSFPNVYLELTEALARNDYEQISNIAHSFKTSSANLGAIRMYDPS